ncbi:MAG TPA: hypothetical protein VGP06_02460 [Janthinobacterium sp.]|jgi:hypothetical protein|nr:hypothetical protein [Janthinobacterium sp.]
MLFINNIKIKTIWTTLPDGNLGRRPGSGAAHSTPCRNKKSAPSQALMPQASALQRYKNLLRRQAGGSSFFGLRILPDFKVESPCYDGHEGGYMSFNNYVDN